MPTSNHQNLISRPLLAYSKLEDFSKLCGRVQSCVLCPRMTSSARILGLSSGSLDAKVMFIGEAPGRLGADATGIPFHGDKAGDNFEHLLDFVGISREDIFVTNAVLCNPKDDSGNNSPPSLDEISNCSGFLKQQIDLINPAIVVTLGASALKATSMLDGHALTLRGSVRTSNLWNMRHLIPLYHPGQRAMIHRSLANQRSDYQFVADQLKRLGLKARKVRGSTKESIAEVIKAILFAEREVSYFALHKILYLLEWSYMQELGKRLTGAYFIRQKDGPYCTDLHLTKLKNAIPDIQIRKNGSRILVRLPEADLFRGHKQPFQLNPETGQFVARKLKDWSEKTDAVLKMRAYLTQPMKDILRKEKNNSSNMYNTPILIGW